MVQKCSLVAVMGRPNVGKSTLVNSMVGSKVAIVSPKAQTTRRSVMGIYNIDETQIVFVDSPGIFKPSTYLESKMLKVAWNNPHGADLVFLLIDICNSNLGKDWQIIDKLYKTYPDSKVAIVLNKIDKRPRSVLLEIAATIAQKYNICDIFMISAKQQKGLTQIKDFIINNAKERPWIYDKDKVTNLSIAKFSAELTRQHIFKLLNKELPYSLEVETVEYTDNGRSIIIKQDIYVDSQSRKPIVVGEKGKILKEVGIRTRKELSKMLKKEVSLFLYVKVDKKWQEKTDIY